MNKTQNFFKTYHVSGIIIVSVILTSALIFSFFTQAIADAATEYPKEWWQEVPRDQAESWEILPQDAAEGEVIVSKRTELGILSNFAATPITLDGQTYASLEGLWQMMKFPDSALTNDPRNTATLTWPATRAEVGQMTGFAAKEAGGFGTTAMQTLGIDFVSYLGQKMIYREPSKGAFYDLILRATRQKISQNPEVRRILLATGTLVLKPDHHQEPSSPPAWRYFDIYMELRTELQSQP